MEKPQNYLSRLRRHPLLWNLALIAAIILAMAVAAHILMQLGTRHGARRTVPDLSGVQLDQAQRIARKHDLQLHINDSLFVPAYEGGIVLDQLPEGGVEVKPGRTVYITINSFRQKMVPVPYVAGRSLRQAKNMLEIAGLEIAELVYRADMATNYVLEEYCEGKPVTPTTRMEAEMGSGVTLYVGVEEGYGTTIVPRLVGLPLAAYMSLDGNWGQGVGLVMYGTLVVTQVDNLVRMVMQKKMADVHPLITIFGVFIGLSLFGFMGVIFGPLMLAMFVFCVNVFKRRYLDGLPDRELFQPGGRSGG